MYGGGDNDVIAKEFFSLEQGHFYDLSIVLIYLKLKCRDSRVAAVKWLRRGPAATEKS